jgi:hypothetical protein
MLYFLFLNVTNSDYAIVCDRGVSLNKALFDRARFVTTKLALDMSLKDHLGFDRAYDASSATQDNIDKFLSCFFGNEQYQHILPIHA